MAENTLYYGDNLQIMETEMKKYSVDLIYLDPPFKSDQNYNLLYRTLTGKPVPEQAEAFCDTWEMDAQKENLARAMPALMRDQGVEDYYVEFWRLWMKALRHTQPHLLAYLIYMVIRLLRMKSVLKPTGSIYLHCDPTASHYIKVMMDGIFGHQNFQNEIIWKRTSAHSSAKKWGPVHDTILYYTASDKFVWNYPKLPHDPAYIEKFFKQTEEGGRRFHANVLTGPGTREGESGEPWKGYNPTDAGRHWAIPGKMIEELDLSDDLSVSEKLDALDDAGRVYWPKKEGGQPRIKYYADELDGMAAADVWTDVNPISGHSKERLGFPTQKPMELLDRIIRASSNEGDVVFDPFCGCGTTIYAAHEAGRQWVGCDVAILAVGLVEHELKERYGLIKGEHYEEHGIPNSVASAIALWEQDPFQFENWAVEYVGGFPTKRTGDKGVDGRIYFEVDDDLCTMVQSVKGGNIRPTDIRDLIGVLASEPGAELAGFISIKEPSRAMKQAAAKAGTWTHKGEEYDRVQLLTVEEMVEEKRGFKTPTKIGKRGSPTGQIIMPM